VCVLDDLWLPPNPLLGEAYGTMKSEMSNHYPPLRKGTELELDVYALAFGGRGIARLENFVVFVEGALPQERVRARINRVKSSFAEATVSEIITPSPFRQVARCPLFGQCGGCKLQNLDYQEQIAQKQKHVEEAFAHIAGVKPPQILPIIPSPETWRYRNKMEMAFGVRADGSLAIGFHTPGDYRKVLDVPECFLQPEILDKVVTYLREELGSLYRKAPARYAPYDPTRHTGFFRHLVMRYSQATKEFLVAVLTHDGEWPECEELAARFMKEFPQCRGFTWGINRGVSDVARMEEKRFQLGEGWIEEVLGELTYRVSTFSFFQTNSAGAKLLYDVVKDFAELTGRERVLDAYCGTGSIGIYLARSAAQIVGIELVREAIWDARHNARRNGLENCLFLAGEMRDVLPTVGTIVGARFDRLVVDPPRGGMDKKSLRYLIALAAPLIVYVSCNPTTLARDTATLAEAGYVAEIAQPVDLFPHTHHVESVVKFRKRK